MTSNLGANGNLLHFSGVALDKPRRSLHSWSFSRCSSSRAGASSRLLRARRRRLILSPHRWRCWPRWSPGGAGWRSGVGAYDIDLDARRAALVWLDLSSRHDARSDTTRPHRTQAPMPRVEKSACPERGVGQILALVAILGAARGATSRVESTRSAS